MRRPVDLTAAEEFLQLLARAVRQFHTYPPTSPICVEAVAACQKALVARDGPDEIVVRVTPRELLIDETGVGAGTVIEQELASRLHGVRVATLTIERAASTRDLSRFCADLLRLHDSRQTESTLADLLTEHGIDKIVASMAERPEVLNVGAPTAPLCGLAARERSRRDALIASGGPAAHLYPPEKGWVRLDPTSTLDTVSLVDLAIFVDNPVQLAEMLLRLTGDEAAERGSRDAALEKKFSEVTTLFAALDPRLAQLMFAKLARAVLDLEPERRKALLQRTILPGLLDGKVDGTVLKDFPDVDLAESLCLLLDLETAAPEVLSAALDRLELPDERRQAMVPLLETHLQARESAGPSRDATGKDSTVDRHARKLIRIDAGGGKSFADFMAFDLSMDSRATETIGHIRDDIGTTDLLETQLRCLSSVVRLEPNPLAVERFLVRTSVLLAALEGALRWRDLASWVVRHRELADALRSQRPDVADAISLAINAFCSPDRVAKLVELYAAGGEARVAGNALVEAFGADLAPACIDLLDDPKAHALARPLADLMCEHAKRLAPQFAARADGAGVGACRAIARVLGFAGHGYEMAIAGLFGGRDEQTIREGLRALARIGTPQAAALVTAQIQRGLPWARAAAEEALWHFPPAVVRTQLRELIGRRDFVVRNPEIAARLLERAGQVGVEHLAPALAALVPLRFRFWNPALVRVAHAARALLKR